MTATISGDGTSTLINLTTSGNTILGDASTDTLNVGNGGLVKDASGNVGIGTASPTAKLHVANAGVSAQATFVGTTLSPYITVVGNSGTTILGNESTGGWAGTTGSQAFVLKTTDTERMRIDSSGNLLVGTTTVYGRGTIQSSGSSDAICGSLGGSNNGYSTFIGRNVSGTATFYVTGAGQISAVSTSITAISDARLKTNIQPIKYGLDTITALKPVMYDFIENDLVQGQPDNLGFIAQDVKEVVPELVSEGQNKAEDDTSYLTLKMGDMLPILVKAIQEQQALITTLTDRITALEAK